MLDFTTNPLIALYFAGSGVTYGAVRETNEHVVRLPDKSIWDLSVKVSNRPNLLHEELLKLFNAIDYFFVSVVEISMDLLQKEIPDIGKNNDIDEKWIKKNKRPIEMPDTSVYNYSLFTILNPSSIH